MTEKPSGIVYMVFVIVATIVTTIVFSSVHANGRIIGFGSFVCWFSVAATIYQRRWPEGVSFLEKFFLRGIGVAQGIVIAALLTTSAMINPPTNPLPPTRHVICPPTNPKPPTVFDRDDDRWEPSIGGVEREEEPSSGGGIVDEAN